MVVKRRHPVRRLVNALALAAVCVQGCTTRTTSVPAMPTDSSLVSPVVFGGDNGLELRWWVVADANGDRLAQSLSGYAHLPTGIDGSIQDQWQANGLRMTKIPLADLASLKRSLPIVGRVDRHWLGQTPRWTELLQGEEVEQDASILLGGKTTPLSHGRIRLLGRAWTSPTPLGPRLRTDLTVQHVPHGSFPFQGVDPMGVARRIPAESRGMILTELTTNTELDPGFAYVIVPEEPTRLWTRSGSWSPAPFFDWGELAGPPAPPMPTIGEALLTGAPLLQGRHELRAVVILIPRTPDRFQLLPSSATAFSQ